MQITVLYVGSSLLSPLKAAEQEINRQYKLDLRVAAYNFGSPLDADEWDEVDASLRQTDVVFVIHVMDGENAARLLASLKRHQSRHHAVIVINCMPELMRRTRMGRLDVGNFLGGNHENGEADGKDEAKAVNRGKKIRTKSGRVLGLFGGAASWVGKQARKGTNGQSRHSHGQYLKLIDRLPGILRFVPTAGRLRDIKNYLYLFCFFLQPTPVNIRSMLLYALKQYVPDERLRKLKIDVPMPENVPSVAIYHPDSRKLFETFADYEKWYDHRAAKFETKHRQDTSVPLDPATTVGLLLLRPQVVSRTTKHYDELIRAIEAEGLSVIPAISTLMDNRESCERFFVKESREPQLQIQNQVQIPKTKHQASDNSRVSQILSLTGFSFVGGPAMNDSKAASGFLRRLNRPYRSVVSLDTQTIEAWEESQTGLNPIQAGMQIAIPEIDGATEPFVYGGISAEGVEPVALQDRCRRLAVRLKRANRLRTSPRSELKLAFVVFCFPPNKGNIGTAADLDVFPSVWDTLNKLKHDGYDVEVPTSPDQLREQLLGGNSERLGTTANVAYRMGSEEYRRLCPFVDQIEEDWGRAPGRINSLGDDLLMHGLQLGNVFVGLQPTFGYEGDPMRLMMARGGSPHHGFMAFYTYLSGVFNADAVIHTGTHGAMEFMPGKQVGLSGECWPDRLTGELPNFYIYSVNNPSEGSIAKRRSYAELISYLTPPVENAGLYKELAALKDLISDYRQATDEAERERLFVSIEESGRAVNLGSSRSRGLGNA